MSNRIIKFRAWDEVNKKMVIDFIMGERAYLNEEGELVRYNTYHLIQFTGLYDKNGREIYDKDILASNTKAVTNWRVMWKNEWGKFVLQGLRTEDRRVVFNSIQQAPRKEVIGNIYQGVVETTHKKDE